MPFDRDQLARECIFELGLGEALQHKWLESQRFGEDLGLLGVRDWCQRHWFTFQRFRRIDHLLGDARVIQFTDENLGIWKGRDRKEDPLFDLILGAFVCGMENLEFVNWVEQQRLPLEEAREIFIKLDPNCVRLDYDEILKRAEKQFVLA